MGISGQLDFPFTLKHIDFAKNNANTIYEPEINIGNSVEYRIKEPCRSQMSIFSTGKVLFKCSNVSDLNELLLHIIPRIYACRKKNKRPAHPSMKKTSLQGNLTNFEIRNNGLITGKRNSRKNMCYCESDESPQKNSKAKNCVEDEKVELSEYELLRERRIKERQKFLEDMNIKGAINDVLKAVKPKK